jgi:hypothetical protein
VEAAVQPAADARDLVPDADGAEEGEGDVPERPRLSVQGDARVPNAGATLQ